MNQTVKSFVNALPSAVGKLCIIIALCSTGAWTYAQLPSYYGHFVGNLILTPEPTGSLMRLKEPYEFIDSAGGVWLAPAGTITDGASIPQVAKSFVGGSWDGPYRNAAVIHDVACVKKDRPWEAVHLMFYHAMLASGVSPRMAKIMYAAVYHFGPRWESGGPSYKPLPKALAANISLPNIPLPSPRPNPRVLNETTIPEKTWAFNGPALSEQAMRNNNDVQANAPARRADGCPDGTSLQPWMNSAYQTMQAYLPNEVIIQQVTQNELTKMAAEIDRAEANGKGLSVEQIQHLQ